jgi:hypothetical protein
MPENPTADDPRSQGSRIFIRDGTAILAADWRSAPGPPSISQVLLMARQETKQRIARWRAMATAIANKNPDFSQIQIARAIQQSRAGKRNGAFCLTQFPSY